MIALLFLLLGGRPDDSLALKPLHTLEGHSKRVLSVAFSRDGKRVATGGEDGTARIWTVESGEEDATIKTHWAVTGLVFSKDDKVLMNSSWGAQVWDIDTGDQIRHLEGHTGFTTCIAYSPDGRTLATGGLDGTVRLWDTKTWQETKVFTQGEQVSCIAISPDGSRLVSGGETMLKVWELTGKEIRKLPLSGCLAAAFLADSKRILVARGEKGICSVDPATDSTPDIWQTGGPVGAIGFSQDRKLLAAVVSEKKIQIWRVEEHRRVSESDAQKAPILSLALSPNGKHLVAGFADNNAGIWSLTDK